MRHGDVSKRHVGSGLLSCERFVLSRWNRDHQHVKASIELLEIRLAGVGAGSTQHQFEHSLADKFIDAPDDFHHILERKAYRRAWFRSGRYLPSALDLDDKHAAMRNARERLVAAMGNQSPDTQVRLREAFVKYAEHAKAAIDAEERELFPLLRRHLTKDDWRELASELRAYEQIMDAVRSRRADD